MQGVWLLSHPSISVTMAAATHPSCRQGLYSLPKDLLANIGSRLCLLSLAALASTCKVMHDIPKLCVTSQDNFDKFVDQIDTRDARETHEQQQPPPPWWRKLVFHYLYGRPHDDQQRPSAWQHTSLPIIPPSTLDAADKQSLLEEACASDYSGAVGAVIDMLEDSYDLQNLEIAIGKARCHEKVCVLCS